MTRLTTWDYAAVVHKVQISLHVSKAISGNPISNWVISGVRIAAPVVINGGEAIDGHEDLKSNQTLSPGHTCCWLVQ